MSTFNTRILPEITYEAVRRTLDQLVYSTLNVPVPELIELMLVDDWLARTDGWEGLEARALALRYVLTELIEGQIIEVRQSWGRQDKDRTRTEALQAIQWDARTGSREVVGWSWLYYRYVRVELEISHAEYSQAAGIDARSLRRYQKHAVQRLTEHLFKAEVTLRQSERHRRLRLAMPTATAPRLIGREAEIDWLLRSRQPQHVQITGPAGIGKTALVQAVLHRGITENVYDRILWITERSALKEGYRRLMLPRQHFALVLDEEGFSKSAPGELVATLNKLEQGTVYLISRNYMPELVHMAHLALKGLTYEATRVMVEYLRQRHLSETVFMPDKETLELLWQESGGNPASLHRKVYALWYEHEPSGMI